MTYVTILRNAKLRKNIISAVKTLGPMRLKIGHVTAVMIPLMGVPIWYGYLLTNYHPPLPAQEQNKYNKMYPTHQIMVQNNAMYLLECVI